MPVPIQSVANEGTIGDFHTQWTKFQRQDGVYASESLFWDYFGPLLSREDLTNKRVAEVGSGNGRFVKICSRYAAEVVGFEPSGAVEVARRYCLGLGNTTFVSQSVYQIEVRDNFDIVLCLGVLHHLPDPVHALAIMKSMLGAGGSCLVWVYGREGNALYLKIFKPLMRITSRLPHSLLNSLSFLLALALRCYSAVVRFLPFVPWPLRSYITNVIYPLDIYHTKLVIYDQLNPRIANYYSQAEIEAIAKQAGFQNIQSYHRHGYSWTLRLS